MTPKEFEKLPKEEQDKILLKFDEHVKYLENSIWDHDPCEYEFEWFLFFKIQGYDCKRDC